MSNKKDILVYADWIGLPEPFLIGVLSALPSKGKEVFAFEYSKEWLQSSFPFMLDPELQLYSGQHYPREGKPNFGLFLDSCPDRWGRVIMDRREAVLSRKENRTIKNLQESDYLLGVFDEHRMGGLRFKQTNNGPFLNDNKNMAAPPWTSLRELENASLKFEEDNTHDEEYLKWLDLLLAPGSSLGGARPKASVIDNNSQLWIAKFPSIKDVKNIGAWEMVVNILAGRAGINTAEGKIQQFNNIYHTYLTKRFDRNRKCERIHFASAMTLLGYNDGANYEAGVSYLEMAEFIIRFGSKVNEDLEELWRRVVFNICVKNTDDHLRNHGFLLSDKGWMLSPAYDINPNEYGNGLSLNISEKDNSLDIDLALSVAEYFRLTQQSATKIKDEVIKAVKTWAKVASENGITKSEQERMRKAFD